MGGGDLNLKKSWHPSTMKNMERVWKAEQQNYEEKKKIAELKRDIEMEREKEDITKYAIDQGVIEKKDDKKLDWMYKGPGQQINREDYLTGKKIDTLFEQSIQFEKDAARNKVPSNHIDCDCVPPSLRCFSGDEQVDLARKIQEDPLYIIKKKEIESRKQILKNPIKMKQLKELVASKSKSSGESLSKYNSSKSSDSKKDNRKKSFKKVSLSEKEKLKRLKEMMVNASWRDKERKKNFKRFKEEEKKDQGEKSYNNDFIRKQLAKAAEIGSVESRIKSNINNIQRFKGAMDKNFAKR